MTVWGADSDHKPNTQKQTIWGTAVNIRGAWLALLLLFTPASSFAYWNPPAIAPASPVANEPVSVVMDGGGCDDVVNDAEYPQTIQSGSNVRIIVRTVRQTFGEFCFIPHFQFPEPLGQFPAGNYTVQVDIYFYSPLEGEHFETLATLPMTVTGADPIVESVPVNSLIALIAFAFAIILLVNRKLVGVAVLFLAMDNYANAQDQVTFDVSVVLSASPGAPAPEDIVRYFEQPGAPSPLTSLANNRPTDVQYTGVRVEGDAAEFIRQHPDTAKAQFRRSIVMTFEASVSAETILRLLGSDPYVQSAAIRVPRKPSSVELSEFDVDGESFASAIEDLQTLQAWNTSPGYSLVMAVETGIATQHEAFKQIVDTPPYTYLGGNFVEAASYDVGLQTTSPPSGFIYTDVDEAKPINNTNTACTLGMLPPEEAGHGTHVAGLIAANRTVNPRKFLGACKHCGLGIEKYSRNVCTSGHMRLTPWPGADADGVFMGLSFGAQVLNLSLGGATLVGVDLCQTNPGVDMCVAVQEATDRDVVVVAASGNDRARIDYPASHQTVISAGGIRDNVSLVLWDVSPGSDANCPATPPNYVEPSPEHDYQCGSNYSHFSGSGTSGHGRQELVTAANAVTSTTYPGMNWNADLECGDSFPGPLGAGVGRCTGTSMSTPQISGIVGILRSINPLAPTGAPSPPTGIRGVLATTTFERIANPLAAWSMTFGYGRPNAAAAARAMLGSVRGQMPRNRVTPLFRLYSAGNTDFADTTSPQKAVSLRIDETHSWEPHSSALFITGYPLFPYPKELERPTAALYVLTTPFRPRPNWPHLKPLYLMSHAAGLDGYTGVDYMLVTSKAEIEAARGLHYYLWNIQGFIFDNCSANCPPGAEQVVRKYDSTRKDCATFFSSEQSTSFPTYTSACPGMGTTTSIGYAFTSLDTDGDGLTNGFEYVAGTNPNIADSDGSGGNDATEYPMLGIPVSDPCSGATGAANCYVNDIIFEDEFSEL